PGPSRSRASPSGTHPLAAPPSRGRLGSRGIRGPIPGPGPPVPRRGAARPRRAATSAPVAATSAPVEAIVRPSSLSPPLDSPRVLEPATLAVTGATTAGRSHAQPHSLDADQHAVAPCVGGLLSLSAIDLGELGEELVEVVVGLAGRLGDEVPFGRLDQI